MASLDLRGLGCTSNPTVSHGYSQSQYPICDNIPSDIMHKIGPVFSTIIAVFLIVLVSTAIVCVLLIARVLVAHARGLACSQAWDGAVSVICSSCSSCTNQRLRRMMKDLEFDLVCEEEDFDVMVIEEGLSKLVGPCTR